MCHLNVVVVPLTHESVRPLHPAVNKRIVEKKSAQNEQDGEEIFNGWFVDDRSQDQVEGHHQQKNG